MTADLRYTTLLVLLVLIGLAGSAATFKLPSFLAWIQPQQGGTSYIATSGGPLNSQQAVGKQPLGSELMMASASSGQASELGAGSQRPKTLKKPLQSMLMLPSKHNQIHLFSSLPRSLFSRLFTKEQSKTNNPQQVSKWPSSVQMQTTSFKPLYPLPSQYHIDEQQLVRQALAASAVASRQPRPLGGNMQQTGRHALGLHAQDDFMMLEQRPIVPRQPNLREAQPSANYREMPAILISETLPAQSASLADFGEQSDSMRLSNGTRANETAAGSEPTVKVAADNETTTTTVPSSESPTSTASNDQVNKTDPTTASSPSQPDTTESSIDENQARQNNSEQTGNGGSVLTSLIGDELLKLQNDSRTAFMSQPLIALLMDPRQKQQQQQQQQQAMQQARQTELPMSSFAEDGDELGHAASQAAMQTSADDQVESFILGPYRPASLNIGRPAQQVPPSAKAAFLQQPARNLMQMPFKLNGDQMLEQQSIGSLNWQPTRLSGNSYRPNPFHSAEQLDRPRLQSSMAYRPSSPPAGGQQRQPANGPILGQFEQPAQQHFPIRTNGQSVPYFVDRQQPMKRERQQLVQMVRQLQWPQHASLGHQHHGQQVSAAQNGDKFYLRQELGRPSGLVNDYQLLIEHGQRQNDAKFKSGLYQIEPPKLESSNQPVEQLGQQQVEVSDTESGADQQQQQEQPDKDDEPESAPDADNSDEQQKSPAHSDALLKQVGASLGVASQQANGTRKGQVFSEPVATSERKGSSQLKSLRLSQDVTLYDFEMPGEQAAGAAGQPAWADQAAQAPSGGYLDTQVFTIPYTLSLPSQGHPQLGAGHIQFQRQQHPQQQQHASYLQQQQQPRSPMAHFARFPLPYMAPPAPQIPNRPNGAPVLNQPQLPSISALSIQSVEEPPSQRQQQLDELSFVNQLSESKQPATSQQAPREHYFHYQPVSSSAQVGEQTIFEPAAQQQQFALTVQHGASNKPGAALFSTGEIATESKPPQIPQMVSQHQEQQAVSTLMRGEPEDDDDSDDTERPSQSGEVSAPSVFCADRAPGLYADESQRCRAYYQCAPTGHQMFRCNNQTQFNQKTQNCDWWYNVDCGGRLGTLADFEQPANLTTTLMPISTSEAPKSEPQEEVKPADGEQEQRRAKSIGASWAARLSRVNQDQSDEQFQGQQQTQESRINSTLAPEQSTPEIRQQVLEPTSSTPMFVQAGGFTQRSTVSTDPTLSLAASASQTEPAGTTTTSSTLTGSLDNLGTTQSSQSGPVSGSSESEEQTRPQVGEEPDEEPASASTSADQERPTTSNPISSAPQLDQVSLRGASGDPQQIASRSERDDESGGVARRQEPETAPGIRFESSRRAGSPQQPASQFANHRYSGGQPSEEQEQIYSTSAYQGSVSYTPANDQAFLSAQGLQSGPSTPASPASSTQRMQIGLVERRFGARLLSPKSATGSDRSSGHR